MNSVEMAAAGHFAATAGGVLSPLELAKAESPVTCFDAAVVCIRELAVVERAGAHYKIVAHVAERAMANQTFGGYQGALSVADVAASLGNRSVEDLTALASYCR